MSRQGGAYLPPEVIEAIALEGDCVTLANLRQTNSYYAALLRAPYLRRCVARTCWAGVMAAILTRLLSGHQWDYLSINLGSDSAINVYWIPHTAKWTVYVEPEVFLPGELEPPVRWVNAIIAEDRGGFNRDVHLRADLSLAQLETLFRQVWLSNPTALHIVSLLAQTNVVPSLSQLNRDIVIVRSVGFEFGNRGKGISRNGYLDWHGYQLRVPPDPALRRQLTDWLQEAIPFPSSILELCTAAEHA